MKKATICVGVVVLYAALFSGCAKKAAPDLWSLDKSKISSQLKGFITTKEALARTLASGEGDILSSEFESFYGAARAGDWRGVTNGFEELKMHQRGISASGQRDSWWWPTLEVYGTLLLVAREEKYATAFGEDIIQSIPAGSIYFGGTEAGQFMVTALCESQADGKPFFALSQSPLPDGSYLNYLRAIYGGKIYTPTEEDRTNAFNDYYLDRMRRLEAHQLKPGEDVETNSNDRLQVHGQMSYIQIKALLAKVIFDKNPGKEFYMEESVPFDWMYPYLEPHSLIMKINRQPLTELSDETIQNDHDYWVKYIQPMIGDWLHDDTPLRTVADFAEKVYVRKDLSGFTGDPHFVQSTDAQKEFSKLRSSIGGVYLWRLRHAENATEKKQMAQAADFAFRQAWALCPDSLEVVYQYIDFLTSQNRTSDALLVAETAEKIPSPLGANSALRDVIQSLSRPQPQK